MQPLFRVRKDADVKFGHEDTMTSRPVLAAKIAECISAWTDIESLFGIFLGLALGSNLKTTLTMYMALDNRAAQLRLLTSVAESELSKDQFEVFDILMTKYLRPVMKTRDKLAHWCWGYSPHLPEDLLLMPPNEALLSYFDSLHGRSIPVDDTKIFVVTIQYLTRVGKDIRAAGALLATLMTSMAGAEPAVIQDPTALQRLRKMPRILKYLNPPSQAGTDNAPKAPR
jgi:hypothetical protein